MKKLKRKSAIAELEKGFTPLEKTKEGLLLGGFSEISAYGSDNCQCNGNNCQCNGNNCQCSSSSSDNCQCNGNNCQCTSSTPTPAPSSKMIGLGWGL